MMERGLPPLFCSRRGLLRVNPVGRLPWTLCSAALSCSGSPTWPSSCSRCLLVSVLVWMEGEAGRIGRTCLLVALLCSFWFDLHCGGGGRRRSVALAPLRTLCLLLTSAMLQLSLGEASWLMTSAKRGAYVALDARLILHIHPRLCKVGRLCWSSGSLFDLMYLVVEDVREAWCLRL